MKMFKYILERFKEPSTLRGLVNFATGVAATVGIVVSPEMAEQIIAVGLAVVGFLGMVIPDKQA
jgi:hypothetical protein